MGAVRATAPPILLAAAVLAACRHDAGPPGLQPSGGPAGRVAAADAWEGPRQEMVRTQLQGRDITDEAVLAVMGRVPRHLFVPEAERVRAYADHPLPIGLRQTISQPYIVAYMTQALKVEEGDRVLEIGTGSGYQAAVLSLLAAEVYTIEILPPLAERARRAAGRARLRQRPRARRGRVLRVARARPLRRHHGHGGARPRAPPAGGAARSGGPPGDAGGRRYQELIRITRSEEGTTTLERLLPVRFVPMTGRAEEGP